MSAMVFDIRSGRFQAAEQRPEFRHPAAWQRLRESIRGDSPLVARFSAPQLQDRWQGGRAGICVDGTTIVAYASLVQVEIEQRLSARVFEASSGWTKPGYRRLGLQVKMRERLYAPFQRDLLISFCVGAGASFVLWKLGWSLFSWPGYLGMSDFIGEVREGKLHHRLGDVIDLHGRVPFVADQQVDLRRHDWDRYLHLWVSDTVRATRLRQEIAAAERSAVQPAAASG